jgi:hypothetical protein
MQGLIWESKTNGRDRVFVAKEANAPLDEKQEHGLSLVNSFVSKSRARKAHPGRASYQGNCIISFSSHRLLLFSKAVPCL